MRHVVTGFILLALAAGCASRHAPTPAPIQAPPSLTAPAAPQPAPQPGITVWAVDPTGGRPMELLTEQPPLRLGAFSPDGRYWLFIKDLGVYKGDYTAVPYLLDRTTGVLREGAQTEIRGQVTWSGRGFFINWPAHLDLALKEERFTALREALGLKPDGRTVIDFSIAGDGSHFAALVGDPWREAALDLVLGKLNATSLTVIPKVVKGIEMQSGNLGRLALSPDGEWLAVAGQDVTAIIGVAQASARDRWTQLPGVQAIDSLSRTMRWSPDSLHLYFPPGRIFDLTGKVVLETGQVDGVTWRPDGKAAIADHGAAVEVHGLDGATTDVAVPDWSAPVGFLADGRLIVIRAVFPQ